MKKNKNISKKNIVKRVLIIVFGLIILLAILLYKPVSDIVKAANFDRPIKTYKYEYQDITLSKEQMLEDFDYLFDVSVTNCLNKKYAEQYYKVDYDELYDTFKKRIENCQDEYEFVATMIAFDAKLPGSHSYVRPPMNENFFAIESLLTKNLDKEAVAVNYSLCYKFEDRMKEYDQKQINAQYFDGDYVFREYDNEYFESIDGLKNGKLISLNGKPVKDVIKDIDTLLHWKYDYANDSVFVERIFFNDGIGEKYEAEIELEDGTIIKKDLYVSAEYNMAYIYRHHFFPPDNNDEGIASEEDNSGNAEKSYFIDTDSDRKLVYFRSTVCAGNETNDVKADLTNALESVDADYVILDFRSNSGGDFNYVTSGVLPAVLNHDAGHYNYTIHPDKEFAKDFYHNTYFRFFRHMRKAGQYIETRENFKVKGEAKKEYKIYALIDHTTFSSGDIFAYIAKQDGITLIGQNTGGEGVSGQILQHYLPNSKLIFAYVDGVNEVYPEDNYVGTTPDYYVESNWDTIIAANTMLGDMDASERNKLENRKKWDPGIIKVFELIE